MKKSTFLPFNLQFFADGDGGTGEEGSKAGAETTAADQTQQQQSSGEKTFTQEEVNSIGAREKNQGKSSILKLFGCADEATAKTEAEEFKKWKASQQTEEQKRAENEKLMNQKVSDSEKRAALAENKLTALSAGITKESLDDALAIALLKVTEEKPLDKVLEDMKKDARYSGFFGTGSSSSGGTGSSAAHNKGGSSGADNIGKRLAESRLKAAGSKSNFFNN